MARIACIAGLLLLSCTARMPAASVAVLGFVGDEPVQICRGFALVGPKARLMTAAHCLRGAVPGDRLAYATREQWLRQSAAYSWAVVRQVSVEADWALLEPESTEGLQPLHVSFAVPDTVQCESPEWLVAPGTVREEIGGRFQSSLDVRHGWSGSPVLDTRGNVIGIVLACSANGHQCLPHTGIFARLPAVLRGSAR